MPKVAGNSLHVSHSVKRRIVDFTLAGFGLGVLAIAAPIAAAGAVVAGAIVKPRRTLQALQFVADGGPFFLQRRYGEGDKIFTMIKLRSLTNKKLADGTLADASERHHWFGDMLRRYSIDELPQLVNVLKGDMTIVGPRPMMVEKMNVGNQPDWNIRRTLRPGLTGYAQLKPSAYEAPLSKKFSDDRVYVEQRQTASLAERLGFDACILWATIAKMAGSGRKDTAGQMCYGDAPMTSAGPTVPVSSVVQALFKPNTATKS